MSKSKDAFCQISGRVGDLVYFVRGGRQIIRSMPASVRNPQTEGQMLQRMKWANVLAVYKCLKSYLKDAFETKSGGQTDYSCFMSTNLHAAPVYLPKDEVRMGAAVVAPYVVSQGSLPAIRAEGVVPVTDIVLGTLRMDGDTTVGEFARAVVRHNSGFRYGDWLSFFSLRQETDGQDGHPYVTASVHRVCLAPADGTRLRDVAPASGFSTVGGRLGADAALAESGVAWVHSRTVNGRVYVSSQRLVVANELLERYGSSEMLSVAAVSYGGSAGRRSGEAASVPRLRPGQGVRRAGIEPMGGLDGASRYQRLRTDVQVEVDDGEGASLPVGHVRGCPRRPVAGRCRSVRRDGFLRSSGWSIRAVGRHRRTRGNARWCAGPRGE